MNWDFKGEVQVYHYCRSERWYFTTRDWMIQRPANSPYIFVIYQINSGILTFQKNLKPLRSRDTSIAVSKIVLSSSINQSSNHELVPSVRAHTDILQTDNYINYPRVGIR